MVLFSFESSNIIFFFFILICSSFISFNSILSSFIIFSVLSSIFSFFITLFSFKTFSSLILVFSFFVSLFSLLIDSSFKGSLSLFLSIFVPIFSQFESFSQDILFNLIFNLPSFSIFLISLLFSNLFFEDILFWSPLSSLFLNIIFFVLSILLSFFLILFFFFFCLKFPSLTSTLQQQPILLKLRNNKNIRFNLLIFSIFYFINYN